MATTLISPRIAVQRGDVLGSGVPYWPIELAILGAFLRERGETVSVVDLFGAEPGRLSENGDHYLQGAPIERTLSTPRVTEADRFLLYALSYMSHRELLSIVAKLRKARADAPIAVLENGQAVTGYSLEPLADEFFGAGADALLCGEPYFNWEEIAASLESRGRVEAPENVCLANSSRGRRVRRLVVRGASYPVPAWELFNLEGYWSLPYAHGPKAQRYLPILTSRGCSYPCDFCVVPETNHRRWRGRRPVEVVEEILELRDRFGVRHFQVEDLNPTIQSSRWTEICQKLIEREADIRFYLVSGTKAETVPIDQVPLLAEAGCRYLSISPESGSPALLKAMGKPFNHGHGLRLVKACRDHGIRTQACFLVGHPAESEGDHQRSRSYLRSLVRHGLDEVGVFIIAPFAGSRLFAEKRLALENTRALPSFSPAGRKNYRHLARRRRELILLFLLEKLRSGFGLWAQGLRALLGVPQTKMENLPRRIAYLARARLRAATRRKASPSSRAPIRERPLREPPRTLLILPCYNESAVIGDVLRETRSLEASYDTLVIDDGSTDGTFEIARGLSPCVRLAENLGIGSAVHTGIRYALERDYDFCVQVDGDGQHPPDQVATLLEAYRAGAANLVIGTRYASPDSPPSTAARRVGSRILAWTLTAFFDSTTTDPTSGLRLLDRRAMALFARAYPYDFPEPISIAWALRQGLAVREVPVKMRARAHGSSSIRGFKQFSYMVRVIGYILLARFQRREEGTHGV